MILWEWRRIYRQKVRSTFSSPTINYKEYSRRKLIIGFGLFFIGWKMFGMVLQDKILFKWDESIEEGKFFNIKQVKELAKKEKEKAASEKYGTKKKDDTPVPTDFKLDTD